MQRSMASPSEQPDDVGEDVTPISAPPWFKRSCKIVATLEIDGNKPDGQFTTVSTYQDNFWPGSPQVLPYLFLGGTDIQKQKVRNAIEEWTWYANAQFTETESATESKIRIIFDSQDGNWSYVGRTCDQISTDKPTMNLALLDQSNSLTLNERGTILHEFGHALGLIHEQESPAHGGQVIRNIQAAIDLYSNTEGWSQEQIYNQVISFGSRSDVSNFSQVDIRSIMHYPLPKELTGLPNDIPFNTQLTDLDKAYMILMYPRKEMHPSAAKDGWSFEKALTVMGAPSNIKQQILQLVQADQDTGEISPVNIRKVIEDWTHPANPPSTGNPRFKN